MSVEMPQDEGQKMHSGIKNPDDERMEKLQKEFDAIKIETPEEKRIRVQREHLEELMKQGKVDM